MHRPLSLILCLSLAALAQDETEVLRYNFSPKTQLRQRQIQELEMTQSMAGRAATTKLDQTSTILWEALSANEDGTTTMRQTIEGIVADAESAMGKEHYDSGDPDSRPGPMTSTLAAMAGLVLGFHLSPTGQMSEFEGMDAFRDALKGNPVGDQMASQIETMISQGFPKLPEEGLAINDAWEQTSETPLPNIGTMELVTTYTYVGRVEAHGRTCYKLEISFDATIENAPGAMASAEVSMDLGEGSVLIDVENGYPIAGESSMDMTMKTTVDAGAGKQVINTRTVQSTRTEPVEEVD